MYQDKAAISLHVGVCIVVKDIKLPNVPEPKDVLSAPLGTSVSRYPAPKHSILTRKLKAEHPRVTLPSHPGAGINVFICGAQVHEPQ